MTKKLKILIVGGGHNGLTCATYLAKSGHDVSVIEARDNVGGMAGTHEFAAGFQASSVAQFLYQLQPQIVEDLELERHGLELAAANVATVALSRNGDHLRIQNDRLSGPISVGDEANMQAFHRLMTRFGQLLQKYNNRMPPLIANNSYQDKFALARLGFDLRRLGKEDMRDFLRVIATNIYDLLNEYFESDLLKGALAYDAVLGTHLGPCSPNSVLTYVHRLSGVVNGRPSATAVAKGGMGQVSAAFAKAAVAAGVKIRTSSVVRRVLVKTDRVAGVELENDDQLMADIVVSNVDPKTTVIDLVGAGYFDIEFVRRVKNLRMRGNTSRLHLALNGLPRVKGLDNEAVGRRLLIAPNMDYVERAFNAAKYGECSRYPAIEICIPTVTDASLAPKEQHVLSATIQYTPWMLKQGWSKPVNIRIQQQVMGILDDYFQGLSQQVIASEFLSPQDIHDHYRVHGGHWHHGELALDQFLFARPVVGASQYQLPLQGLYLCGAGTHPGGGVSGSAGRNAALAIDRMEQQHAP